MFHETEIACDLCKYKCESGKSINFGKGTTTITSVTVALNASDIAPEPNRKGEPIVESLARQFFKSETDSSGVSGVCPRSNNSVSVNLNIQKNS